MNSQEAERQITQMIEFIKQEAKEKAEEINVKTDSEFNAKKLNMVQQAKTELKEEFAKKAKEAQSKKRIARSRLVNEARLNEMRERDKILKELKDSVYDKLAQVSQHPQYKELIKALIIQGLLNVMENKVELRCRQVDSDVVQSQLQPAVAEFKAIVKRECGVDPQVEVVLNTKDFLAPPPTKGNPGASCTGGVLLTARFGKIICRNTLDARFELAYENLLPVTRELIFGRRAAAAKHKEAPKHH